MHALDPLLNEAQEADLNDLPISWLGWIMSHHRNLQMIEGFRPQPRRKLRALQKPISSII